MDNYYAIEAGGTKFVCCWGTGPNDLHDMVSIPTTTPADTILKVIAHIKQSQQKADIKGIGAAIFGPLGLNPEFEDYGFITSTPKLAWRNYNIVGVLKKETGLDVVFDTDVNVTAMGEHKWGAAKNISDFVFLYS